MASMTPEELLAKIEDVTANYSGSVHDLYRMLGVLVVGEKLGWRVLRITLNPRTYLKYQKELGVDFKEIFPEEGVHSRKSVALDIVKKFHNFWNVVKGIEKIQLEQKEMLIR